MREILGHCVVCTDGVLLPQVPLPAYRQREDVMNMRLGPAPWGKREPQSTSTLLSHLACSVCGLMYAAKQAGTTLEKLREEAYKQIEKIEVAPQACPCCSSTAIELESSRGPFGVQLERIERPEFSDPSDWPVGVYCKTCNSVLGTLPPDPEKVRQFTEHMAEISERIEAARAKRAASALDADLHPLHGVLPIKDS